MAKLIDFKNHQTGIITKINGDLHFQSRAVSIGIIPNAKVEVLQNSKKQPVLLYCQDTVIALSKKECKNIEAKLIDKKSKSDFTKTSLFNKSTFNKFYSDNSISNKPSSNKFSFNKKFSTISSKEEDDKNNKEKHLGLVTKKIKKKNSVVTKKIALLGQPNSGKSTLFNALTGSNQHVGNWPGKTVTQKSGSYLHHNVNYEIIDLPGTYSLSANSEEEIITRDYIEKGNSDLVFIFLDSSQLRRSSFIFADYIGIKAPTVLVLNMIDVAENQGKKINIEGLEKELGIPIIPLVGLNKKSYSKLHDFINKFEEQEIFSKLPESTAKTDKTKTHKNKLNKTEAEINLILDSTKLEKLYSEKFGEKYTKIKTLLSTNEKIYHPCSTFWLTIKLIEKDKTITKLIKNNLPAETYKKIEKITSTISNGILSVGDVKFNYIDYLAKTYVVEPDDKLKLFSFDKIALHPRWGKFIAFGIILAALCCSFLIGNPLMEILSNFFDNLSYLIAKQLDMLSTPHLLISFLCDGVINAISFSLQMISYIFGISLIFGIIENIGYMARISYVFDNLMGKLGLQGKSVMPFILGFGCTVGGSTGTRVIDSWNQKILTIALSWVVPCASTWGVVGFVSYTFFKSKAIFVIIALFAVAILHIFITDKIFSRKLLNKKSNFGLIIELPPYHRPHWKPIFSSVSVEILHTLRRAFFLILGVCIIFWLLSYSPDGDIINSLLFKVGNSIEPVTMFFGLSWQFFIAFIVSLIGKEAALGVLASLFSTQSFIVVANQTDLISNTTSLSVNMFNSCTQAQALAFLFIFFFNVPCLIAFVTTVYETHSFKWTLKIGLYYIGFALLLSALVFHVSSLFL